MKIQRGSYRGVAFTLPEVLVVLAIVVLLVRMLIPARPPSGLRRAQCVNNLKNIGLAFRIFAEDNKGEFPFSVSTTNGGSRELHANGDPFAAFLALSTELRTPNILHCSLDKRSQTTSWTNLSNQQISYFLNTNADQTSPTAFLSGDRNIECKGKPIPSGKFAVPAGASFSFDKRMHNLQGNICMADGSVQQLSNARILAFTNHPGYVLAVP